MAVDPLSQATRAAKRNLLIVSVLAVTFRAFDVSIEQIPIAGLSIRFDKGVFSFLLLVALLYFILTFALYYIIDIRNIEQTSHEVASRTWYTDHFAAYGFKHLRFVSEQIDKAMGEGIRSRLDEGLRNYLPQTAGPVEDKNILSGLHLTRDGAHIPKDRVETYKRAVVIAKPYFENFSTYRATYLWRYYPRLYGTRLLYITRNHLLDGALPIAAGIVGFLAILDVIDVAWLRIFVPKRDQAM